MKTWADISVEVAALYHKITGSYVLLKTPDDEVLHLASILANKEYSLLELFKIKASKEMSLSKLPLYEGRLAQVYHTRCNCSYIFKCNFT